MSATFDQQSGDLAAAPFFSVVMPLFNKAGHLRQTLASIAAQHFTAFEVIVVDDGSTDDSVETVQTWGKAAAAARLRLVRQANAGPGLARNRGIAEARGAWIAFLDADDLWMPDHLATLFETIAACPAADVVAADFVRADTTAAIKEGDVGTSRIIDFFEEHERVWTSAAAVRTSLLQVEGFGAAWPGEDVELWARLALRHQFAVHSRCTAVYVQHTGGIKDSEGLTVASTSIERKPLFSTIEAVLRDETLSDRHSAVAQFRNSVMLEHTRPSLFNGHTLLARAYLRELRKNGGRAPLFYEILAHIPAPLLRQGTHLYSMVKGHWQHRHD